MTQVGKPASNNQYMHCIYRIDGGFGQSKRDLAMMPQISCTKGLEAIKLGCWVWFDPLCSSRGRIRVKRRIFRVRRSVREKRSVAEAMVHIISSTSIDETPFTRASIVEEQSKIMSEPE